MEMKLNIITLRSKNTVHNTGYSSLLLTFLSEIPAYLLTLVYGGKVRWTFPATKP